MLPRQRAESACEGRLVPTEAELARHESRSYEPASTLLARVLDERYESWTGRGKYKDRPAQTTPNFMISPKDGLG
jgi:type I restriction enzyme S subunit